jgi:zinc/manganese transport system substrate-binding protein/manganese/iron transport system substrate-binding protein
MPGSDADGGASVTKIFWALVILGISVVAVACSGDDDDDGGGATLNVVTTLPLFADLVREVGGNRVDVDALLPSGADPHTWEPAPQDAAQIADADIVFANGLDLEPSALSLIEPNMGDDAVLVELGHEAEESGASVLPFEEGGHEGEEDDEHDSEEEGHEHSEGDPHLWMDIDNARAYVEIIRDTLSDADPEGAADYAQNAEAYLAELDTVEMYVLDTVDAVPEEHRYLITTHDAFGYLADFIGFEIAAFVAEGPGQDVSPDAIREILDTVEETGVPAVFREPQLSGEGETLQQVASDAGVEVCTLYSDSLDDTVSSYIELMRFDADEIARCLGGGIGG